MAAAADAAEGAESEGLQEIVVTATKQSESITKVPLSVVAYTQDKLDREGTKNIADLVNLTPGVAIGKAIAFGSGAGDTIAIRGISSTAGSPTTAIYIDDTPIQVRLLNFSSNAYPEIFDLERVEVLRGPQGTLFGGSSEGGNIRFITPTPSLTQYSVYGRSELAFTQKGAPSAEAGVAFGGPIVSNELGFRASIWTRQDGGWIDRQDYETKLTTPHANSQNTIVSRAALTWRPLQDLSLTPTMFYQRLNSQDTSSYWPSASNSDSDSFVAGYVVPQPRNDLVELPALKAEYTMPGAILTSITSFLHRHETTTEDFTDFESALWSPSPYPYLPGQYAYGNTLTDQNNFNQEIRLQSADPGARLNWVVGAFYSKQRLHSSLYVADLFLPTLVFDATGATLEEVFGQGLVDGRYTVTSEMRSTDTETALFGQSTFGITARLKVIAGVRVSKTSFDFSDVEGGPINGPTAITSAGGKTEHPVTPKVGIEDQYDDNNLYYATVAKGYRVGGAQVAVPAAACGPDLETMGVGTLPRTYNSDSLWSYEIGAKNKFAADRVQVSSSVFYVNWSNIQQLVPLPTCGYTFVTNTGKAASMGFDTQLRAKVTDSLVTELSVAYTNAELKKTVMLGTAPGAASLVSDGDKLDGFTPWSVVFAGEYHYRLLGNQGYTRANVQFHSAQSDRLVRLDPRSVAYDPANPALPSNTFVTLRSGVSLDEWDLSIFVDNLLDAHPPLARTHDIKSSPLFYQTTFRPRTIGLTAVFRH